MELSNKIQKKIQKKIIMWYYVVFSPAIAQFYCYNISCSYSVLM